MKLSSNQWEKLLSRWATVSDCGERRLMQSLLALALSEEGEKDDGTQMCGSYFEPDRGFDRHLSLIGIDPAFVREQFSIAHNYRLAA